MSDLEHPTVAAICTALKVHFPKLSDDQLSHLANRIHRDAIQIDESRKYLQEFLREHSHL